MNNQCCGTCLFWGKRNYGDSRFCKQAKLFKRPKKWPSSVQIQSHLTKATEGTDCPLWQPKEPADAN